MSECEIYTAVGDRQKMVQTHTRILLLLYVLLSLSTGNDLSEKFCRAACGPLISGDRPAT